MPEKHRESMLWVVLDQSEADGLKTLGTRPHMFATGLEDGVKPSYFKKESDQLGGNAQGGCSLDCRPVVVMLVCSEQTCS